MEKKSDGFFERRGKDEKKISRFESYLRAGCNERYGKKQGARTTIYVFAMREGDRITFPAYYYVHGSIIPVQKKGRLRELLILFQETPV